MHHFQCNVEVNDKINTLHLVSQVPVIDKSRIITVITSTNSALWYNISIVTYFGEKISYLTEVCTRYKVDVVKSYKFWKFDNELHLLLFCVFSLSPRCFCSLTSCIMCLFTITERFLFTWYVSLQKCSYHCYAFLSS